MLKKISEYYKVHPLTCILLAAFLVRLVAVCFAKGYGMHDDHFTIVETARSWVDGYDSENWLPSSQQNPVPGGHSLLYPGLQFLLFEALHLLGIDAAGVTMWVTRFFLAIFSLLTVYFGYKITEKEYGKRIALQAGWTLALFWALPWLSVRNLVEIVCIPFLLWGCWAYLKGDQSKESRPKANLVFWSGFLLGLAFSFRFQTLVFSAGFGLGLMIMQRWRDLFIWSAGLLASIFLIQGGIDMFIWGRPFAEMTEYIRYNMYSAYEYITSAWYTYLLLLLGLLIPPVSIGLMAGMFSQWRKYLLFLPLIFFLIFHSLYPNKQERFILTLLPFIIILGLGGWDYIYQRWFSSRKVWRKIIHVCVIFAIVMNSLLLIFVSVHYSKRSRVESMAYLSIYPNIHCLVSENTNSDDTKKLPLTYLEQWPLTYKAINTHSIAELKANELKDNPPAFILFEEEKNLKERLALAKKSYPNLVYEAVFTPSLVDRFMYKINRHNANFVVTVYRNKEVMPIHLEEKP